MSGTTMECGWWSPSLRAFSADWTKLLKHLDGVYWTRRCFWVHLRPRSKQKVENRHLTVSLISWKLDVSIFRGWVNSLLSSAYFFMKSRTSERKTNMFLKYGVILHDFVSKRLEIVYHIQRKQTFHRCVCLIVVFGKSMLPWRENLILQKTWFHHSLLDDASFDTPKFQS